MTQINVAVLFHGIDLRSMFLKCIFCGRECILLLRDCSSYVHFLNLLSIEAAPPSTGSAQYPPRLYPILATVGRRVSSRSIKYPRNDKREESYSASIRSSYRYSYSDTIIHSERTVANFTFFALVSLFP